MTLNTISKSTWLRIRNILIVLNVLAVIGIPIAILMARTNNEAQYYRIEAYTPNGTAPIFVRTGRCIKQDRGRVDFIDTTTNEQMSIYGPYILTKINTP